MSSKLADVLVLPGWGRITVKDTDNGKELVIRHESRSAVITASELQEVDANTIVARLSAPRWDAA